MPDENDHTTPTLSIVIVSWNTREITRDCLQSIAENCEGLELEVLVVDNASTDKTAEMIREEFPLVRLTENTSNRGFAAANNQAFALCRGRWILLLNSDTVVLGSVLQNCVSYMERAPEIGVLACRVLNPDLSMQATCSRFPTLFNLFLHTTGASRLKWPRFLGRYEMTDWQRDDDRDVEVISGCFMFVSRTAIRRVGGLDESFFLFGEETDWCRRFLADGWRLRFAASVGEIIHLGSASARKLNARRDLFLTRGIVRFNRNYRGNAAAVSVFVLLWFFNASRLLYWSIRSIDGKNLAAEQRRAHFGEVVRHFRASWPQRDGDAEVEGIQQVEKS